jgi:hypothetical protein
MFRVWGMLWRDMTSRMSPVGGLIIALAGLLGVGCSAQTSAVFDALLDARGVSATGSQPDASTGSPADASSTTWWPHPEGYAMDLPAGWSGMAVDGGAEDELLDIVADSSPELATRILGVLDATDSRISAVAADPDRGSALVPMLLVIAQPTHERPAHAVKSLVKEQISGLPGLTAGPFRNDVPLPYAKGVRYEFSLDDPDLGELMVRAYLFRFGSDAYLVTFVASADGFDAAEAVFEAIAQSLRFGV